MKAKKGQIKLCTGLQAFGVSWRLVGRLACRLAVVLGLVAGQTDIGFSSDVAKVAVSQIVEHPALDATRKGIRDGLADLGYTEGENLAFTYQTAQGNPALAAQIARKFVGDEPDVLVGIATPTAQALAAATTRIPIVYTAVTDPVGAKLIASLESSGNNVTGLSDQTPVDQHLALIREILPDARTLGVVYNPGEANSLSILADIRKHAASHGFAIEEGGAPRSAEVGAVARVVAGNVDAIYAPTDNTVASAISSLVAAATSEGIPVIGAETSYADAGALAALGFDYYRIGRQTADVIVRVLRGDVPSEIPSRVATGSDLFLNVGVAETLGISIPDAVQSRATRVIE